VKTEVFLDTAFVVALTNPADEHYERAQVLAEEMRLNQTRVVTTHAVLLEVGNALSKQRFRRAAIQAIEVLHRDPAVEIVLITGERFSRAFELFRKRPDKEWGLVDCTSFVIMADRRLTEALTSDQHFEQAGFVALLRQP
jgi:predicted nucleic acid-binding protein